MDIKKLLNLSRILNEGKSGLCPPLAPPLISDGPAWLRNRINKYVDYLDYLEDLKEFEGEYKGKELGKLRGYMKALHDCRMENEPSYEQNYNLRVELNNQRAEYDQRIANYWKSQRDRVPVNNTALAGERFKMDQRVLQDIYWSTDIHKLENMVDTPEKRKAVQDKDDKHLYLALLSVAVAVFAPPLAGLTTSQAFLASSLVDGFDAAVYFSDGEYAKGFESLLLSGIAASPEMIKFLGNPKQLNSILAKSRNAMSKGLNITFTPAEEKFVKDVVDKLSNKAQSIPAAKKAVQNAVVKAAPKTLKPAAKLATSDFALIGGTMVGSMEAYEKGVEYLNRKTPNFTVKALGLDWDTTKRYFYSSGSAEDNLLLKKAVLNGWRPGDKVPEEFQTQSYKDIVVKKQEAFDKMTQEELQNIKQQQEKTKEQNERAKNNQLQKDEVYNYTRELYKDREGNPIPASEINKKINLQGLKEFLKNNK